MKANKKTWIFILILGILASALGIFLIIRHDAAFDLVSLFVSIYFLVTGICGIISTIANHKQIPLWGFILALYIIATIIGIDLLTVPGMSDVLTVILAGIGILSESISTIFASIDLKRNGVAGWGWLLALGIILVFVSIAIITNPFVTWVLIGVITGIGILVFGIESIIGAIVGRKIASFL